MDPGPQDADQPGVHRPAGVLDRRTVAGYALGSAATGTFGTVPGLVLLFFLTDTLAVPAAVAGVAVFVPKFFDVLWNPVVGGWSDRTVSRWGARRPWMLAGGLTLPLLFVLVFAVPDLGPSASALWVCLAFLLAGAAYGLFQVPYISLPAELTPLPEQRTRLQTARIVVLSLGILVGGAVAPELVKAFGSGVPGYVGMAAVVAVVLAAGMLGCVALVPTGTTERAPIEAEPPAGVLDAAASLGRALRLGLASPAFRPLYLGYLAQSLAVAVALAAIPYYARYVLDRQGFTSVLFAAFVGPAIVVVPLWRRLARRRGQRFGLLAASWLFAASVLFAGTGWGGAPLAVLAFLGCGIAYGALQLFCYAMLSDALAAEDARTGRRQAGLLSGLWTASETGMFAVGPFAVGVVLAVFGFVSSSGGPVAQPASATVGVALAMGVLPAVLVAVSTLAFRRYDEAGVARLAAARHHDPQESLP
jgi:Na+/melibiose symporter-like transporter